MMWRYTIGKLLKVDCNLTYYNNILHGMDVTVNIVIRITYSLNAARFRSSVALGGSRAHKKIEFYFKLLIVFFIFFYLMKIFLYFVKIQNRWTIGCTIGLDWSPERTNWKWLKKSQVEWRQGQSIICFVCKAGEER